MRTVFDFATKRAELSPEAIAFEEARQRPPADLRRLQRPRRAWCRRTRAAGGRFRRARRHPLSQLRDILRGAVRLRQGRRHPGAAQLAPDPGGAGARPRRLRRAAALARCRHRRACRCARQERATCASSTSAPSETLIVRDASLHRARDTAWPTDRIWYLLYTSGTTGRPKAVIQTVGMALANYVNVQQATGLTGADTTVNFLPLFHTAGINLHTLPLFLAGGTQHGVAPSSRSTRCSTSSRRGASRCSSACPRSTRR